MAAATFGALCLFLVMDLSTAPLECRWSGCIKLESGETCATKFCVADETVHEHYRCPSAGVPHGPKEWNCKCCNQTFGGPHEDSPYYDLPPRFGADY